MGSAKGLSYLHDQCDPKIIHHDVKAANILLDEDFEAVVGDFGLAKLMDYKDAQVTTPVSGTMGHIAPEYHSTGKSSEKKLMYSVMELCFWSLLQGSGSLILLALPMMTMPVCLIG